MSNIYASIRGRLASLARKQGVSFQLVIRKFAASLAHLMVLRLIRKLLIQRQYQGTTGKMV